MIIILQWYLRQNIGQLKEQDLKMLTPKQILQRLPVALAQVKAGNNSANCLFFESIKTNHQKSMQ